MMKARDDELPGQREDGLYEKAPMVSVIIPVFNNWKLLALCLQALSKQTYSKSRYEVIVVDNGSDDQTAATALRTQFPAVVFVAEPTPGSYAARNRGVELAKGSIVAFTDSDCIPTPHWLENGVLEMSRNHHCGLVAGAIELLYRDPTRLNAAENYECIFGFPQEAYLMNDHFGATANLFTQKAVFNAVGLFNEKLMSGGDAEWGKRVFAYGYHQVYSDSAVVRHPSRQSIWQLIQKRRRVAGGSLHMQRETGRVWRAILVVLLKHTVLRPGMVMHIWRSKRITSPVDRIKVICIRLLLNYVFTFEYLRVALGGKPCR